MATTDDTRAEKAQASVPSREALEGAIAEQQVRAWHLRSLIEVLESMSAISGGDPDIEDLPAALAGVRELADHIHEGLDIKELSRRASAIEHETAAAEEAQS